MSIKEKLEAHYKLSLELIYKEIHIKNKISLNQMAKDSGLRRQSITDCLRKNGFKTRSIQEATKLTKNKGKNHYNFGKTKDTDKFCKAHSERMLKNNPMYKKEFREKASESLALYFKKNPLPQEIRFIKILKMYKILYKYQYPIAGYIIDFYISKLNLCIEIDSMDKLDADKRAKIKIKDKTLHELGYKVLRICRTKLYDLKFIEQIFRANNLIL